MSKYGVISGPYFPVFGLNTGKYESEITPYLDTFHAVIITNLSILDICVVHSYTSAGVFCKKTVMENFSKLFGWKRLLLNSLGGKKTSVSKIYRYKV